VALLRVFAYGTLADYRAAAAALPPLNAAQELKLKKLTVATLAEDSKVLAYE
jgi:COP9 signalosome complex subunit 7